MIARSVKGDDEPHLHTLVREFLSEEPPVEYRERGYDRCSDAAALSDALHLEDAHGRLPGWRRSRWRKPVTRSSVRPEW